MNLSSLITWANADALGAVVGPVFLVTCEQIFYTLIAALEQPHPLAGCIQMTMPERHCSSVNATLSPPMSKRQ